MRTINWSRVILGGLTAGVIINVFEFILNGAVLAKDWEVAIQGLGRAWLLPGATTAKLLQS